jgi:hypothetical protein
MAVTSKLYGQSFVSMASGQTNFATGTAKAMLCTSAYTPNPDTHRFKSDVTNEITGTGYTAGGTTLTTKTANYTAANSWGTARANTTAYAVGDVVRPATANGYLYRAVAAGTSAGAPPTYPTVVGQGVTDGGVTWNNIGTGITVLDADDPTWAAATLTARYLVFYIDTGTGTTSALISYVDFGADVASTAAAFTYQLPTTGLAQYSAA